MCAFIRFLSFFLKKNDSSSIKDYRRLVERDCKTFGLCLKTISQLLSVKSQEIPLTKGSNLIWEYFNGPLDEQISDLLEDLDQKEVKELLLEVTGLLSDVVSVGLTPFISKLEFDVTPKEFYFRTVALMINLSISSYKRFGELKELDLEFISQPKYSTKNPDEWRISFLKEDLTFCLVKLTLGICIFGIEEVGLFKSFNDLPRSLLGLFSKDLWVYILGSFPSLFFDSNFLFSLNSLNLFCEMLTNQCYPLIQYLLYLRSKLRSDDFSSLTGTQVLMFCNWLDFINKYVKCNINLSGFDRMSGNNSMMVGWLSTLFTNKLILDVIYVVFKHKMCIETTLSLAEYSDNVIFLQYLLFKEDLELNFKLNLLSKLGLKLVSKDVLSLKSILDYLLEGVKGGAIDGFLKVWKVYLSEYCEVINNSHVINSSFTILLNNIVQIYYENMKLNGSYFECETLGTKNFSDNLKSTEVLKKNFENGTLKESLCQSLDQVLLLREVFLRLVKILDCKRFKSKFISSVEEGMVLVDKSNLKTHELSKVEFSLFLIYVLNLNEDFSKIVGTNGILSNIGIISERGHWDNSQIKFILYLVTQCVTNDPQNLLELEVEYNSFMLYRRINKQFSEDKIDLETLRIFILNPVGYHLSMELIKNNFNILDKILNNFPDLTQDTLSNSKQYLKNSLLYFKVYNLLNYKSCKSTKLISEYMNKFENVVVNSLAIFSKYDQLVKVFGELIKELFDNKLYKYLSSLEYGTNLSDKVSSLIMENWEDSEGFFDFVSTFIITMGTHLTSEINWNKTHLVSFEKLLLLLGMALGNPRIIDKLITKKNGYNILSRVLVIANSITVQDQTFKLSRSYLNLTVLDSLLDLSVNNVNYKEFLGKDSENGEQNWLSRSYDFGKGQLEQVLTSSFAKFQISLSSEKKQIALGNLSILDLMIYQSFGQIFGDHGQNHKKDVEKHRFNDIWNTIKNIRGIDVLNIEKTGNYKNKIHIHFSSQLFKWNLLGPEYLLTLEFLEKMFLGFSFLPQTKLLLISDYFFEFGSFKTNMKPWKIRKKILTDNKLLRIDSPSFVYELLKSIKSKTFT